MAKKVRKKSATAPRKRANAKKKNDKTTTEKPILPYLLIGLTVTIIIIVAIELNSYLKRNTPPDNEIKTESKF